MKKLALLFSLILCGCTSSTTYGECVGITDDGMPDRVYKTSTWNVAMAIIFSELIIVPIVVVATELKCPIAVKEDETKK